MIREFVNIFKPLNNDFIPLYNTPEGREYLLRKISRNFYDLINDSNVNVITVVITGEVYDETLATVTQSFPQYIKELQGTADGAQVEFYKVRKAQVNLDFIRLSKFKKLPYFHMF